MPRTRAARLEPLDDGGPRVIMLVDADGRLAGRPAWHEQAACAGEPQGLFFEPEGPSARAARPEEWDKAARRICGGCEVRATCLNDALRNRTQYGIFGGLTAAEREILTGRLD